MLWKIAVEYMDIITGIHFYGSSAFYLQIVHLYLFTVPLHINFVFVSLYVHIMKICKKKLLHEAAFTFSIVREHLEPFYAIILFRLYKYNYKNV